MSGPGLGDVSCGDLLALVAELRAVNAALVARVAEQDERISAQEARIAALERALSPNRGNSSMPPSRDDLPGRRALLWREGRGGQRSKRPGVPGSGLAWQQMPDELVSHHPGGVCGCGADLADAVDEGVARSHQVHEVPLTSAKVVQHGLHAACCGCGRWHVATRPDQVGDAPVSYGPSLRARVVYLLVFPHLPGQRCAQLVADITSARPSDGCVHGRLATAVIVVKDVIALIRTVITTVVVAGFDETTLRVGPAGTKQHVRSACTDRHTRYWLGGRNLDTFTGFGVLPAFGGIAVYDRCTLYDPPDLRTQLAGHQLGCSQLRRDIADAAEAHPDQHWLAQAERAHPGLIRAARSARDTGRPAVAPKVADPLITEFRQAVRCGLSQIRRIPGPGSTTKQPVGRLLLECLGDRENDVLRFVTDTRIWPTNNTSERDPRPLKTQRKISGRLTSDKTTRDRLTLRSYLSTAAKHGIDVMTALLAAITGNPWQPIPAET